jgi:dienelactone hydrolase
MAGKWPILRHLRRCDRHSVPDQADLPRTSRSIPEELLAQSLNQAPIPASPVLMLLGDQDDNLPLTKVESYLAYARAAGAPAPIQTVIYSGAYHAWTVPDLPTARFYPDLVSTKKCPLILLGPNRPALLIEREPKPFDPSAFGACIAAAPGYSMGFDATVRAKSIAEMVSFLERSLQP